MKHLPTLWTIIQDHLSRGRWAALQQIYDLVQRHAKLDAEDFEPQAPLSEVPKWQRNVRNVPQYRKTVGDIQWDGDTHYLLMYARCFPKRRL